MTTTQDERISYNAFYPKTFLFSLLVAAYSHRRRSLQLSGALAANLIGYLTLANPNPIFGGALLSFFTLGTIATRYKQKIKINLVDESDQEELVPKAQHNNNNHNQLTLGNPHPTGSTGRDWKQVLCNAWFGTLCALSYSFFDPQSALSNDHVLLSGSSHNNYRFDIAPLRKALVSAALAYWAGCAGDTFASELGILSRSKPRLITNLKEVPPGTNGAVSILGLVFSTLGGLLIGGVSSIIGEPHQSRQSMIISCGFFGLLCSMLDSVLGATLQQTIYSKNEKKVVAKSKVPLGGSREIVVICGINLLTNNQVNLISSTTTGILAGLLSYHDIIP